MGKLISTTILFICSIPIIADVLGATATTGTRLSLDVDNVGGKTASSDLDSTGAFSTSPTGESEVIMRGLKPSTTGSVKSKAQKGAKKTRAPATGKMTKKMP